MCRRGMTNRGKERVAVEEAEDIEEVAEMQLQFHRQCYQHFVSSLCAKKFRSSFGTNKQLAQLHNSYN